MPKKPLYIKIQKVGKLKKNKYEGFKIEKCPILTLMRKKTL